MALPAEAAKRLTVAQLEQVLMADSAAHKQDQEIARQISGLELTERLSEAALERLSVHLASNSQAALALRLLADQSEFLDPASSELTSSAPIPDADTQLRMLNAARSYVSQTLPRLPNFLATRVINLFDDSPQALKKGEWPTRAGLHPVGTSSSQITVREERENQPSNQGSAVWQAKTGLISGGEFGSTLGMILTDTINGEVKWSHWEPAATAPAAVFRYSVPASASHYEVISALQREAVVEQYSAPSGTRGIAGIATRPNVSAGNTSILRTRPAYHGSIWVDPADGSILRITMEAELKKDTPFRRAAILVQYGPVPIGGRTFICPVRSLALSDALQNAQVFSGDAPTEWLNETVFTGYHRFASTSRILDESAASPVPESPPAAPDVQPESFGPASPQPAQGESAAVQPPPLPLPAAPSSDSETRSPSPSPPAAAEPSVPPEFPAIPPPLAPAAPAADTGFTLQMNVNVLLVPTIVRDKNGRAVGSLGRQDFAITDGGKPRTISGLTLVKSAPRPGDSPAQPATPGVPVAAAPSPSHTAPAAAPRYLVLLFDDRHLTAADLPLVQKAATRLLDQPLPEGDYAAVLSFMGINSGITRDRAALQAAIMKLTVHQALQHDREDCPDVDYYSADQIIHQHDALAFQIAVQKARQCSSLLTYTPSSSSNIYSGMDNPTDVFQRSAMAAATHALAVGEQDARDSLAAVETVIRAMAKLQGQRTLILVSPGFLSLSPETMAFKSRMIDMAAASSVVVNALDARGLYAGNIDASQGGNTSMLAMTTGQPAQNQLASMQADEAAMSELAYGTGGAFFHNSNDLEGGIRTLAAAPEYLYLLEVSLKDVKADGAYHRLQVKVDQPGLDVQARKGYFAPKAASSKK